jgi:hypothetical protein
MLRDGSLEISDSTGVRKPEIVFAKEVVQELAQEYSFGSKFSKPEYFVPISVIEGMTSAE